MADAEPSVCVDLRKCRYPAIHAALVGRRDGWVSAAPAPPLLPHRTSHPTLTPLTPRGPRPTSVRGGPPTTRPASRLRGDGVRLPVAHRRVPLLVWSDLSVPTTRMLQLRREAAQQGYAALVVNHFPGMERLSRKAALARTLQPMQERFPSVFGFTPPSYASPAELPLRDAAPGEGGEGDEGGEPYYVVKPSAGCMGRGIYLTPAPGPADFAEDRVVQRYIDRPLLVDGRKFDVRCYVLVASVDPLRVYVAREGLVRLCTVPYARPSAENAHLAAMHLSNYAVNRAPPGAAAHAAQAHTPRWSATCSRSCAQDAAAVKQPLSFLRRLLHAVALEMELCLRRHVPPYENAALPGGGPSRSCRGCCAYHDNVAASRAACDRALAQLPPGERRAVLEAASGRVDAVWRAVDRLAVSVVLAALPSLVAESRAAVGVRCFEVLGLDVLLDEGLAPWLVEVNHSPSWSVDGDVDAAVKPALLDEVGSALGLHQRRPAPASARRLLSTAYRAAPAVDLPTDPVAQQLQEEAALHLFERVFPPRTVDDAWAAVAAVHAAQCRDTDALLGQ